MAVRPLTQDDLRRLVCPACHQPLRLAAETSAIHCTGCSRLYQLLDGLPVLLTADQKLA